MNNQIEQYMTSFGGNTGGQRMGQGGRLRRFIRGLSVLLLGVVLPASALAAVDLQITSTPDGDYERSPAGSVIKYQVNFDNGGDDATGVALLFDLPAGTAFAGNTNNSAVTCSVLGQSSLALYTRVICRVAGKVDGPQTFDLSVDTQDLPPGTIWLNSAIGQPGAGDVNLPDIDSPVGDLTASPFFGNDSNPGNNVGDPESTTLVDATDLELTKVASTPSSDGVIGGGEITYTITVKNNGPNAATGFNVTELLGPNQTVPGAAIGTGWTFSGINGTYGGTLAKGETASYSFKAKVEVGQGTVTNSATVTTGAGQPKDVKPANDTGATTTKVLSGADVTIRKDVTPAPAIAGEEVTFKLEVRNYGPDNATNLQVVDNMPAGFVITSIDDAAGFTCNSAVGTGALSCTLARFDANAAVKVITVKARAPTTGLPADNKVTNTATVSADTADPNLDNNSADALFTVLPDGADLSATKSKTPALVPAWEHDGVITESVMTSTLGIYNQGPRLMPAGAVLTDTLQPGEQWVDANGAPILQLSSGGWTCTATAYSATTGQTITCTLNAALAATSSSPALTLHTLALKGGVRTNEACATTGSASVIDPNMGNNCVSRGVTATDGYANLHVTKLTNGIGDTDNVLKITDESVQFTVTVTNVAGSSATAGVVVEDKIPGYVGGVSSVTFNSYPAGWNCQNNGGTVTCKSGTTKLGAGEVATIVYTLHRGFVDSLDAVPNTTDCPSAPAKSHCNVARADIDIAVEGAVGQVNKAHNSAADWFSVEPVTNVSTQAKVVEEGASNGRAGVTSTYRITYKNAETAVAKGVAFRDVFHIPAGETGFVLLKAYRTLSGAQVEDCTVTPTGTIIVGTSPDGHRSYSNDGPGAQLSDLQIQCGVSDMPRGASENLYIAIRPNIAAGNAGSRTLTNTGSVQFPNGSTGADYVYNSDPNDDSKEETLRFEGGLVDLIINKKDTGFKHAVDPLGYASDAGSDENENRIYYSLEVANDGPSLATGVNVVDTLRTPDGATVKFLGSTLDPTVLAVEPPGPSARCQLTSSNPVTNGDLGVICAVPSKGPGIAAGTNGVLAAGETSTFYLVYRYESAPRATGETVRNTAEVKSNEAERNSGNNIATQKTSVRLRADLAIQKNTVVMPDYNDTPPTDTAEATWPKPAAATPQVSVRQPFWYVLDVINNGPGDALSIATLNPEDDPEAVPTTQEGALVTDTLPAGLKLMPNKAISWRKDGRSTDFSGTGTCSSAGTSPVVITCALGDMSSGGRARILVPVRWETSPGTAAQKNTAKVQTAQVDPVTANNEDASYVEVVTSSIAGTVFFDSDRTSSNGGIKNGTEQGLSGFALALSGTDAYGEDISSYLKAADRAKTSDGNGGYVFNGLAPAGAAGYTVLQTQLATYVNGDIDPPAPDAAQGGGTYAQVAPATLRTSDTHYTGIKLPINTAAVGYNFPEIRRASLSGYVFVDMDANDVRTLSPAMDPGIDRAIVQLVSAAGKVIPDVPTDSSGYYIFTDLDPLDTYTLKQPLPTSAKYVNRHSAVKPGYFSVDGNEANSTPCTTCAVPPADGTLDSITNIKLENGFNGQQFNFGEDALSDISGFVYVDRNANGSFDAGDKDYTPAGSSARTGTSLENGGLANVTIVLTKYARDGSELGTEEHETDTDNGSYAFTDLPVGMKYSLAVKVQPSGYGNAAEHPFGETNGTITISSLPVAGSSNNNFGKKLGSIAGFVYEDFSGTAANSDNGSKDSGELAIASVSLRLTGTDVNSVVVSRTATTDSDGAYRFPDLLAGDYTVVETQPSDYLDGKHSVGTIDGVAVGTNTTANTLGQIVLPAGKEAINYQFGELKQTTISGTVYIDRENNGSQDGADGGVPGVTITIEVKDEQGNWSALTDGSLVTNASGFYSYEGAIAGKTYRVIETQPTLLADGLENGTASSTPNHITITNLSGNGSQDNNFGEIAARLSGVVYLDSNNNGVRDAGEPGLPGVVVSLPASVTNALGVAALTATTDNDGNYVFQDLLAGIYTVTEQLAQPVYGGATTHNGKTTAGSHGGDVTLVTEVPSAIRNINLPAGESSTANNFGEVLVAGISGTVYVDRNDNGSFDGADTGSHNSAANGGIVGVEVVLYEADGVTEVKRVVTDAQGNYAFTDLPVGVAYVVKETQPVGYAEGKENASNSITTAVLPTTGVSGQNFGETLAALAGVVYEDFSTTATGNNNGNQDSGEAGIAGVTLTLSGTDAAGNPVNRTATTDASGAYNFDDLLGGTYTVTETQPTGYEDGKHKAGNATVAGSNAVANILSGIGLDAGQQASGYLFGELKKAPISGTVYVDRNDNGTQDGGEPGIPGVTITITSNGPDGVPGGGDDVSVTITTDSDGNYSWPDALPGVDYTITETQPSDLANGQENGGNTITITNLPSTGVQDNNFGEKAAVLSGAVYLDSNNNGVRDAGEPGLANVQVTLPAGVKNVLGVAALTATTDNDGNYVFQDLLAGIYTVTEQLAQPVYGGATTHNGKTTAGSHGGDVTLVTEVPSAIRNINLPAGESSTANNFGEVLVAGISGTVYVDRNDNGSFDGADTGSHNSAANGGIVGVEVVLYEADGVTEVKRVVTDAQGNYAFTDLPVGVAYVVKETQPVGYAEGKENASNSITTAVLPTTGVSGQNFGETLAALAGVVYEDFSTTATGNNNGNQDSGEAGIAGVTLTLSGTDAAGNPVNRTATTDASGAYNFGDLLAGTYTVTETQPTGYEDGKHKAGNATVAGSNAVANILSGIGLDAGQQASGYLFGELKKAPISGTVYVDRNDNGDQDGSEPGIPGVTITITSNGPDGVPGGGDDVSVTITTDSDGNYSWPDALPGVDYTITETQPSDLADGKENGSNTITITNLPSTGVQDNNFGEKAAVLSGVVYLDSNNNGVRDAGEPGLANVEVALPASVKNVLGVAALTATTDNDGNYVFQDLLAGTYTVTEQAAQPSYNGAATINGITTVGTTGGAVTSVTTVPSAISGIRLAAGGKSEQNNFGEVLQVSIAGTVFLDVNNDGAHAGAGENGLADVVIELTGVDDVGATVALSTTTDKDGKFSFEGLRPGKYSLTEPTQPTGTANGITTAGTVGGTATGVATPVTTVPSVIADIDLSTPGSASVDNLFGEIPRSSGISGKVWEDSNNDGVVDPGEKGLGGVTVELEGTAIDGTPIKVTVTTDPDGNYSFTELPPGTYTVIEPNQPPGTLDGKTVPGSTGGTPTAPGTPASKISTIKVGVNETSSDNNFGEIPVGSIAGYVYNDSNDDGIKQGDETGYAVIDVVLTGTDDLGNAVNASAKTDTQGHYVFENLRPGTYTVTEPTQPAETLNGLTTAGTIDGVKSTAKVTGKDTVPSAIDGIVLKPGNNAIDNNFGEIGDSPDMLVSKSSSTVKFTVNNVATYTIRVRNGGQKASFGEYLVKDRLPAGLTLAEVPAGNGWNCSGAVGDGRFECRSSEVVAAGTTSLSDITVKVNVLEEAAKAGTVNNAVLIEGGGENEFRTPTTTERGTFEGNVTDLPVCDAAITQNVCRVQNEVQLAASVGGTVWFDIGSDDALLDGGDERLQSWVVELVDPATGAVSKTATTAVDGSYRFADVIPGQTWNIQFRDPASGVLWAWPVNKETAGGMGVSCDADKAISGGGASACRISENGASQLQVVLQPGAHLPQQSLPVDPSGVVYDATTRDPVPGSIVTLSPVGVCNGYDPLTAVLNAAAGGYRVEGNAISMTVGNNGYYQFMFGPAAPARCEFRLTVTPPGGYQFVSSMIPPQDGSLSPAGAAGSNHLVQPQATAPTGAVGTPTQYWLTLFSGSATAGIIHNHIPLDTAEATGLVITKTGDRQTAEIGDTVQYTITVRQTAGSALATVNIVDTLPRGFTYIDGTGRVGGRAVEDPLGKPGPRLGFNLGSLDVGGQLVLTYRVRVGVGAQQGDGVNRAQAHGCSIAGGCIDPVSLTPVPGSVPSNRAEYRVRVTGGVFTEEACVLGKVFVDCNNNHVQDEEELGIPGVRMYFSNGTWMVSDSEGKYSYCGLTPQSHTLKVDPSTLPVGARLTTSSNRNLGDADSLFLDLKNGELHRADFVEGSCSNPLLEQVKARRTQGEVRAPETETGQSQLRFDSKPARAPQQATDSSKQGPIVQPRPNPPSAAAQQEVQP